MDYEKLFGDHDQKELAFVKALFDQLGSQVYDVHFDLGGINANGDYGVTEVNFVVGPQFERSRGVYVEYHFYNNTCFLNQKNIKTTDPSEVVNAIVNEMRRVA